MDGVLNTTTRTVHRRESESSACDTVCGATKFVATERLDPVTVERALAETDAMKCGRCFADGGSY